MRGSGGVDRARIGTHRVLRRVHVDAIHPRASGAGRRAVGNGRATGGGDGPRKSPRVPRGGVGGRQTRDARVTSVPSARSNCSTASPSRRVRPGCRFDFRDRSDDSQNLKIDVSDGFFAPDFKNNGGSRRFLGVTLETWMTVRRRLKRKTPIKSEDFSSSEITLCEGTYCESDAERRMRKALWRLTWQPRGRRRPYPALRAWARTCCPSNRSTGRSYPRSRT